MTKSGTRCYSCGITKKEVKLIEDVAMTMILIAGSVSDIRNYKIPNVLILLGWLTGLAFHLYRQGCAGLWQCLFCISVGVVALLPLYVLHMMGAGDIKLLSVIGGFYGMSFWVKTGILFIFLAGAVSLLRMLRKGIFLERFRYLFQYMMQKRKGTYYLAERDGTDMVIAMAPVMSVAFFLVLLFSKEIIL